MCRYHNYKKIYLAYILKDYLTLFAIQQLAIPQNLIVNSEHYYSYKLNTNSRTK